MIPPSPGYDVQNESAFRRGLEQDKARTVRTDRAAPFLLITDQDTQETYKLTVETGAIVLTVVP